MNKHLNKYSSEQKREEKVMKTVIIVNRKPALTSRVPKEFEKYEGVLRIHCDM